MMEYKFLRRTGAIRDGEATTPEPPSDIVKQLRGPIDPVIARRVPQQLAELYRFVPLSWDGETLTIASADADNIKALDDIRAFHGIGVRALPAPEDEIRAARERLYANAGETISDIIALISANKSDSDYDLESDESGQRPRSAGRRPPARVADMAPFSKPISGSYGEGPPPRALFGRGGMFYYTVDDGERVLVRRRDGTLHVVAGPSRFWIGRSRVEPMRRYVAFPGSFLIVQFRDGRQEHVPGPAVVWFVPRLHQSVKSEDALQLAAKEAVVAYSRGEGGSLARRVVTGPTLFVPQPGEWLHTFAWHGSSGGSRGEAKVAKGLVFQKLWLMPDQMYHDVSEVRTADDAVLTVRLMIFFELLDIERMLDTTHDPIGDFVNAATSDVVGFVGRHDFEGFKRATSGLNDLETYAQLTNRAGQCGYRINKVVYRGYDTAESLQQMHDQAIEARTKLQLDRATEQQAQELENYKLDSQLARAGKRRSEQTAEVEHDLGLARRKQEAELRQREAALAAAREARRLDAEQALEQRRRLDGAARDHIGALREMGVDLTAYLTQSRADRVIELRGQAAGAHVHLDPAEGNGRAG